MYAKGNKTSPYITLKVRKESAGIASNSPKRERPKIFLSFPFFIFGFFIHISSNHNLYFLFEFRYDVTDL